MDRDKVYHEMFEDLRELEQITDAKIHAVLARDPSRLVALLQQEIDPMHRVNARMLDLQSLTTTQKEALRVQITRWANREQFLATLLEQSLGYIQYLKELLGIQHEERPGLNLGL
ncbi:MAG: hypothetical protein OWU33_09605 [Firmicutes bacterium]|nr:hypothetical protein [Bacillota bacterium]